MAISTGSKVLWSDMRALFDRVNSERNRFGFSVVNSGAIASSGTKAKADVPN